MSWRRKGAFESTVLGVTGTPNVTSIHGRYDEARVQRQQAVVLRRQGRNRRAEREARWMVAWTLRSLNRSDEALAMQLQLEAETDAAITPDGFVFDELVLLYRARGDNERAAHFGQRRAALPK